MAGVRKNPQASGRYQGWYVDYTGKQRYVTCTKNKTETRQLMERKEAYHREIRLGYRPKPGAQGGLNMDYAEAVAKYLKWGKAQGGLNGRPWSDKHYKMRLNHLSYWGDELQIETLGDMVNCLGDVETAIQDMKTAGKSGKTIKNYVGALKAFASWCVDRDYFELHPLRKLSSIDSTPVTTRRALTDKEEKALLRSAPPKRRLIYETALSTGLRANELRNITVGDVNFDLCQLHLKAEWTKNRQAGTQPLPKALLPKLEKQIEGKDENDLLFDMPTHTGRAFNKDIEKAGIPKESPDGKVDFHALRVTFVTNLIENGASAKEAQTLARHSTPDITMNTYARTRRTNLQDITDRIGQKLLEGPGDFSLKHGKSMLRKTGGNR
jgi:integrase